MWLDVLDLKHYPALRELIAQKGEPGFLSPIGNEGACVEGYVIVRNDGKLAGCVTFSDYVPGQNVIIHAFIDPDYRCRWIRKSFLKEIADYAFEVLDVPKITAFAIEGMTDGMTAFLERIGFQKEGVIRKGIKINGKLRNLIFYGLLKEERRW
jgi:RimJ/RimL family protein N-acetyltransferase